MAIAPAGKPCHCQYCDFTAPNPGAIRRHYKIDHPNIKRKKKAAEQTPVVPALEREHQFIVDLTTRFQDELAAEELEQGAYDRVCAYITSRFGSDPAAAE